MGDVKSGGYGGRVDLSGTYEPLRTAASQAEMEAGTEAAIRSMSPLRVKQAIDALASGSGLTQEEIEDLLGTSFLVAGTNVTLTYGDNGAGVGTLTIDAANGLTQEQAEDIAAALIDDNSDLDWTYDDPTASLVAVIKAGSVTNAMLADGDLADLATRWAAASASGPASLDFAEDTDNGTSRVRVIGQSALAADRTLTLPDETDTLATQGYVATADGLLIPKSIVDAAGDLIIGTADNTVARMAIGTAAGKAVVADPNDANKISVQYPHTVEMAHRGTSGSLASTCDRASVLLASAAGGASGTLTMDRILLPKGLTITSITFFSGTTALASGSNQWFGLFDSSRVPLRLTNDDTSTAWAANTPKTLNLTSTFTTTYAGWYYLGCCIVASTVPDRFGISGLTNAAPRATAPIVGGSSSTGLTNPASCPNPAGAITTGTVLRYGEVS